MPRWTLHLQVLFMIFATATCGPAQSDKVIILTESSIGPLDLNEDVRVSLISLQESFERYTVTHSIRSGDSPDFHYFEVSDSSGEVLFSIQSFIDETEAVVSDYVDIGLLQVHSPNIPDQFGIRVGDLLSKARTIRGDDLTFGANHFDNYIGENGIYYSFFVPATDGEPRSPVRVTLVEAITYDPKISTISWPLPRWE